MVMVYSASIAIAEAARGTGYHPQFYLIRQTFFAAIGALAAYMVFQMPMRYWQKAAPYLFVFAGMLLVVVLVPFIGKEVNGSRRWLPLGVINLQPSELMKLFVVLYAADYTVRKAAWMHSLRRGFLPMFSVMFAVGVLLLLQPDFGALAVIASIAMGILFLGGMNWRLFASLSVFLVAGLFVVALTSPYRLQRMVGFWDPFKDYFGKGYQLSHALIAFGRGEWLGVGLGASVEKLFYLPEAHTDFLLAVIGEELGFVGVLVVVALFAAMVWRAFAIGSQAAQLERYFSALVAQGTAIWLGVQAIINMGVNLGVLPTKGLTLPFLSFGGSGLAANCCALALVLRVDYENRQLMRGRSS
ncbi:MAG: putative lipid II flippase FtsW [Betaproteobacteria bacterium]|nr:putative lipid II flippase FtsW [Betaproteobacteria bacterium]